MFSSLYLLFGVADLTSPWMRGVALMALCRDWTSSDGLVIRDVPVSTMASQPLLQRVSWLPTAMLTHAHTHNVFENFHTEEERIK